MSRMLCWVVIGIALISCTVNKNPPAPPPVVNVECPVQPPPICPQSDQVLLNMYSKSFQEQMVMYVQLQNRISELQRELKSAQEDAVYYRGRADEEANLRITQSCY